MHNKDANWGLPLLKVIHFPFLLKKHSARRALISRSVLPFASVSYCCNAILSVSCYMKNSLRSRFPSIIFFRKQM